MIKCNGRGTKRIFFFFSFLLQAKENLISEESKTLVKYGRSSNWHELDVIYNRRELNNR